MTLPDVVCGSEMERVFEFFWGLKWAYSPVGGKDILCTELLDMELILPDPMSYCYDHLLGLKCSEYYAPPLLATDSIRIPVEVSEFGNKFVCW